MKRDAIDLGTLNVSRLFRKYFIPTLFGMLSMSAVTAIDGIFVGHGIGSDGLAAVNICVPLLMVFTGIGLMVGAGVSVVASMQLSRGKLKAARINVAQALLFVTAVAILPSVLMLAGRRPRYACWERRAALYPWPGNTCCGLSPRLRYRFVLRCVFSSYASTVRRNWPWYATWFPQYPQWCSVGCSSSRLAWGLRVRPWPLRSVCS